VDVPNLFMQGIARVQEYKQITVAPITGMNLMEAPADLLVHVMREEAQVGHRALRAAVGKLLEAIHLPELYWCKEGSSTTGGGGEPYLLKGLCASTWPQGNHVVAFVKDVTGMWLLMDNDNTPRQLGRT
jgi:hypothetical protein